LFIEVPLTQNNHHSVYMLLFTYGMFFLNPTGPFCTHGWCSICPTAKDRKTDWKCCPCSEWVCKDNSIMTIQIRCNSCKEQSYWRQISFTFMF